MGAPTFKAQWKSLIATILLMVVSAACEKFTFKPEAEQAAPVQLVPTIQPTLFAGVSQASLNSKGQLVLGWEAAVGPNATEVFSYEIYQVSSADSAPALKDQYEPVVPPATASAPAIINIPVELQPSATGKLIKTLTGQTSYEVEGTFETGMTYLFQVIAVDSANKRITSDKVVAFEHGLTNVAPFTGIESLTSPVHASVTLTWSLSTNENVVGYRVYSGTGFSILVATLPATAAEYKILALPPEQTAVYGVRAFNRFGQEDTNTATLSVSVLNSEAPSFFGLTLATVQQNNQAVLTWQPAQGNPKEYHVYQGTTEGASGADADAVDVLTPIAVVPAPATTYTVTGLGDDQQHHFIVRAATSSGVEDQNVSVKMVSIADLGAPVFAGPKSLAAVSGGVAVTWDKPIGQVTTYKVYASQTSPLQFTNTTFKESAAGGVLTKTLSQLGDNTTFYVGVRAVDRLGQEDTNTTFKTITVGDLTPPNFLGFVGVGAQTVANAEDKLTVSFARSVEGDTDHYSIRVRKNGTSDDFVEKATLPQAASGSLSTTISGLSGATAYDVQVKSVDTSGNASVLDTFVTATTADLTPPSFAGVSGITRDSANAPLEAVVAWNLPLGNDAAQYRVYYSKSSFQAESFSKADSFPKTVNGKTIAMKLISSGSATSTGLTILSDLDQSSTYYVIVRATDSAGNEDSNTAQRSYVVPLVTPPVFGGVTGATVVSGTRNVQLSWTPPDSSNAAAQYLVYVSTSTSPPRTWSGPVTVAAPATGYTVTSDPADSQALDEMATYYFKVNAKNVEGFADTNATERAAGIPDITAPTFGGLSTVSIDSTSQQLVLEFSTATDAQAVKEYRVYWKALPSGSFQALASPGKTVTQTLACTTTPCKISVGAADGLTPGQLYQFRVDAVDINVPENTAQSAVTKQETFPDFTPPAAATSVSKSPEPTGATNQRNYTVSGSGIDGLTVRVYCYNVSTSTLLALGTCGGSTVLSGSTSFAVPVTLPATDATYQLRVVQYKSSNLLESTVVNAGATIALDQAAPALVAFTGCSSGLCLDVSSIGGASATVNQAIMSFKAGEAGTYQVKKGASIVKSGSFVANARDDIALTAADLSNVEGSHNLNLYLADAGGNISAGHAFTLTVDVTAPLLNTNALTVTKVYGIDNYALRWSTSGVGSGETFTITQVSGSTAPTFIAAGQTKASNVAYTTDSISIAGANTDALPQSFSLFACDTVGNCGRSSVVLNGGFSDLRNDSSGSTAKYIWAVSSGGGTGKVAYSSVKSTIDNWDGFSTSGPSFIAAGDADCTSPSTTGCSLDFSSLQPWQKRYLRVAQPSSDGRGITLSPIYIYAKVPDGMVYVDKDAWVDEAGFTYSSFEKFSFAIDKYEGQISSGSLNGSSTISAGGDGIIDSIATGTPNGITWYGFKRGCNNRSANWSSYVGTTEERRIHLATGIEWVTAAYGTPGQGGQYYCNVDQRGTPVATDATGTNDTSKCISYFGARNMIGNFWEATDDLLTSRNYVRFYGASTTAELETLPVPVGGVTNGSVTILDYDPMTAMPVLGSRNGPWTGTSDSYTQNWGAVSATPTGAGARIVYRGGDSGFASSLSGRFANLVTYSTNIPWGGRCALVAPTPGKVDFRNDSDGSKARFIWRLWGDTPTVTRLAFAKVGTTNKRENIDAWTGASAGSSLSNDVYTMSNYSGCTDSSFNSTGFEVVGTGTTTSGALGKQGRCGVDLSGLNPWEQRYVKLYAANASGEMFSDTFLIARVPTGMVFVGADDWPNSTRHRKAAEYGESYTTPYDFAIDKYETTVNGSVPDCTTEDFPCTTAAFTGYLESTGAAPTYSLNWFTHKQGCDNRTAVLGATWADTSASVGSTTGRRVHLPTGLEWMVAAFDTPDAVGPQFCSTASSFWDPLNDTAKMEQCRSRYGVRNMIGNAWEWSDELVDYGQVVRYWANGNGLTFGLANTWPNTYGQAFITDFNFNLGFPTTGTSTQANAAFYSDKAYAGVTTTGAKALAAYRGGNSAYTTSAGRFSLRLDFPPTTASGEVSSRCALVAP